MFQRSLLKDEHIEPVADGVYATLEKVGVLCQNAELLQALGGAAHEEAILRKAQARVKELVAAYRRPQTDPDTLARLRAVIERARKSLP